MTERADLAVEALTRPAEILRAWPPHVWARMFQQARAAGLVARIGLRLQTLQGEAQPAFWPANLQGHIAASMRLIQAQRAEVDRELGHIGAALRGIDTPVVLLKGAAYHAADLPPARSRTFSDIDVLVGRDTLPEAESRLMLHGWMGTNDNDYDQQYYREWMHELPPMQHVHRGTTLDLHHSILPLTARLKPKGQDLVDAAVPLPAWPGLYVLDAPDMVLHAITHLFMNEDLTHALRDLSDIDLLVRYFSLADDGFWARLLSRAQRLGLRRPLHYGLAGLQEIMNCPIPYELWLEVDRFGPPAPLRAAMRALWRRALRSGHPSASLPASRAAMFALYVRGHWLKMPPTLLLRHLTIKALRLHEGQAAASVTAPTQG